MNKSNTAQYTLSLSYGKDSLACIEAVKQLGWPLDRIIHSEIWATETLPADLPPMVEFKIKADEIIKSRYGIEVEHIQSSYTYEDIFYKRRTHSRKNKNGQIYGWPGVFSPWCSSDLKKRALKKAQEGCNVYLGIAVDEPKRIAKHQDEKNIKLPLVELGWTEFQCYKWCEGNDLLSPIYSVTARGGCWFCHNQSLNQLRYLYHNYPTYWELMLKWDNDSPVAFKQGKYTVHDYDRRFQMEDENKISTDKQFRWSMIKEG